VRGPNGAADPSAIRASPPTPPPLSVGCGPLSHHFMGGTALPTALVTGSPERVSDIAVALKSHGFDVLAAGSETSAGGTDPEPGTVDCYVELPGGTGLPDDHTLSRARAVVARLAPQATVVLVADGRGEDSPAPDLAAGHALIVLLAKALVRDDGPVRAIVVDEDWTPGTARTDRPAERAPWRSYLDVEPDLGHADWREEIVALSS
jgi:hypothetical protein